MPLSTRPPQQRREQDQSPGSAPSGFCLPRQCSAGHLCLNLAELTSTLEIVAPAVLDTGFVEG